VVDVTEDDRAAAEMIVRLKWPHNDDPAENAWLGAASAVAHRHNCNPGGEMMGVDVTDMPETALYPRNVLMSKADIEHHDGQKPISVRM
jgi:hypothetical protein